MPGSHSGGTEQLGSVMTTVQARHGQLQNGKINTILVPRRYPSGTLSFHSVDIARASKVLVIITAYCDRKNHRKWYRSAGTGALDCLPGATAPSIEQIPDRGQPETLILAITSNMLKNSNVLLIPHAAAITERNVTQRYLALWTPRLLSVGLIRCKRGWSHRLTLQWTREKRELAHLNLYRLEVRL